MNKRCALIVFLLVCGFLDFVSAAAKPDTTWTYKTIDSKELKMAVFLPEDFESAKKTFPAIVIYHGGSWRTGTPDMHYPDCEYWSRRGMIAVSVDYRLKNRDNIEVPLECVKDAKSAVRFLRKNAEKLKVDPDKLVVAGGSAGGQMAAAVAMIDDVNDDCYDLSISCKPNAVILYNPWFKCAAELSPPNFVTEGLPPMITFVGSEDQGIPAESLVSFHADLKQAGNASELYVGKGGKHGFCNGRNPQNRFFYWSLELEDRFLVAQGILSGASRVEIPDGVAMLQATDYDAYD